MARCWPHLARIANELSPVSKHEIGLLIGYNCPKALVPRDVIPHDGDGPFGLESDLGWGIVGMVNTSDLEVLVSVIGCWPE